MDVCRDSVSWSACDAPGRREDVSHAPGRVVPAQVRVALRVLVRHAHAELCALVHLDLPVILASDGHQVAQNRYTPARETALRSCRETRRVRPRPLPPDLLKVLSLKVM